MSDISDKQYLYGADTLSGATILSGGLLMVGYNENDEIVGGGTAIDTVVNNGVDQKAVVISAFGTSGAAAEFNNLQVNGGSAVMSGAVNVNGLVLSSATIIARNVPVTGTEEQIHITNAVVNDKGKLFVNYISGETSSTEWNYAKVDNIIVNNGGAAYNSRTIVSGGTVNSGGTLQGWHTTFNDVIVSGGIFSGSGGSNTMNRTVLLDGEVKFASGKVNGVTISGGTFNVKGTQANMTFNDIVMYGGVADLKANYLSTGTKTSGEPFSKWWACAYNGVTVSGGVMNVSGGNFTNGLNVAGGEVNFKTLTPSSETTKVSSGAFISGAINVTGGVITLDNSENAAWVNDAKATWNFDLSARTGADAAFVNDFSFTAAKGYSITVAEDQISGTYAIAGNASKLDGQNFTLTVGSETITGGITVNGAAVQTLTGEYTLALTDGALALSVVGKTFEPVMLYKGDTLVASGTVFDGITLGGTDYDAMVIMNGGTVTNLNYVSGAISVAEGGILSGMTVATDAATVIDYEVSNLDATAVSSAKVTFKSGAVVHGANLYTTI